MTTSLLTSPSLLERARNRADTQAWERLLTIYEPWLRGWLARHELQPADVEDVLQEILVAVSVNLAKFVHNGQTGAFRSWLRTILTHRVRNFLRGQRHRQALLAPGPLTDWLDQLEDEDSDLSRQWDLEHDRHLVRRVLASVQPEVNAKNWQVFQMLMINDRPVAEVAEHFAITPNAVYVAKARVLTKLREELRGLID